MIAIPLSLSHTHTHSLSACLFLTTDLASCKKKNQVEVSAAGADETSNLSHSEFLVSVRDVRIRLSVSGYTNHGRCIAFTFTHAIVTTRLSPPLYLKKKNNWFLSSRINQNAKVENVGPVRQSKLRSMYKFINLGTDCNTKVVEINKCVSNNAIEF